MVSLYSEYAKCVVLSQARDLYGVPCPGHDPYGVQFHRCESYNYDARFQARALYGDLCLQYVPDV